MIREREREREREMVFTTAASRIIKKNKIIAIAKSNRTKLRAELLRRTKLLQLQSQIEQNCQYRQ